MKDEELTMAELLRRLEWSKDGRGGKQRAWVREAIGGATDEKPRLVHLSAATYRRVWMRRDGSHEIICCRQSSADEANAEAEAHRQRINDLA